MDSKNDDFIQKHFPGPDKIPFNVKNNNSQTRMHKPGSYVLS